MLHLHTTVLCPLAVSFPFDSENEHFYWKEFHSPMSANLHLLVKLVHGTNTAALILIHNLTPVNFLVVWTTVKSKGKNTHTHKSELSISCLDIFFF